MAADAYSKYSFSFHDAKIATWTATATYGTAVDVDAVKMVDCIFNFISGEAQGDDAIVGLASILISVKGKIQFTGVSIAVLEVLLGLTSTSSVASPNAIQQFKATAGKLMPYFGLTGMSLSADAGGQEYFFPKLKIMGDVNLASMGFGTFGTTEVPFEGIADGTYDLFNLIKQQTAILTAAVPPANIA